MTLQPLPSGFFIFYQCRTGHWGPTYTLKQEKKCLKWAGTASSYMNCIMHNWTLSLPNFLCMRKTFPNFVNSVEIQEDKENPQSQQYALKAELKRKIFFTETFTVRLCYSHATLHALKLLMPGIEGQRRFQYQCIWFQWYTIQHLNVLK